MKEKKINRSLYAKPDKKIFSIIHPVTLHTVSSLTPLLQKKRNRNRNRLNIAKSSYFSAEEF
jgi:hypothetical protein